MKGKDNTYFIAYLIKNNNNFKLKNRYNYYYCENKKKYQKNVISMIKEPKI